jgi:hypothetical protein
VTASEEIWQQFNADGNRVSITGDNKVRLYFAQFSRALNALQRAVEQSTGTTNAENKAVNHFVLRLCRSFEPLALKFFFSGTGQDLKIDATDSGFPHFSTLLELAADLGQRDAELAALPSMAEMKKRMLQQIVEHSLHPRATQIEMIRRTYLEALDEAKLFHAFLPGPLEKVGKPGDDASYFWSFATYDRALNRPYVYLVYFQYDGKTLAEGSKECDEIASVAERTAAGRLSLLAFSHRLDELLPRMRPRIVKRLAIGPFFSPIFTHNEGELGALLERLQDRLPFVLLWDSEILISEREARVGAGWLSKGQLRQVFWIPKSVDLAARGVSQIERFVLMPHWLAQQVQAGGIMTERHHLVIDRDEKIRGLD